MGNHCDYKPINPLHVNWNHVSIFQTISSVRILLSCYALVLGSQGRLWRWGRIPRGIGWCLCRRMVPCSRWKKQDEDDEDAEEACRDLRFAGWWFHDCFCCITDATCTVKMLKHPIPALRPNCLLICSNSSCVWDPFLIHLSVGVVSSKTTSQRNHQIEAIRAGDKTAKVDWMMRLVASFNALRWMYGPLASCNTCNKFVTNYGWISLIGSISPQKTISNINKPYPINAFWAFLSCFGPGWRFCVALLGTRFLRKNAACLHPWQICCANREHQIPFDIGYCTNSCRDHGITWNYCIRKYVHMPIHICQSHVSVLVSKIIKDLLYAGLSMVPPISLVVYHCFATKVPWLIIISPYFSH